MGQDARSGGSPFGQHPKPDFQSYRYTFLGADHEQIVAALELFIASEDAACGLANELLRKSAAQFVEVWSGGRLVLSLVRPPHTDTRH
jgi:hypothetical protein